MLIALCLEFQPGIEDPISETKQNDLLLVRVTCGYLVKCVRPLFVSLSSNEIGSRFEEPVLS